MYCRRPILCVVDLSESSGKVVAVAARIAYANKTHLTILFPYRLIGNAYNDDISILRSNLEQDARGKFSVIQEQVELLEDIFFEFCPEIGFAVDRINSYVRQNKVDMVVISQVQVNSIEEVNLMVMQNFMVNSHISITIVAATTSADLSSN